MAVRVTQVAVEILRDYTSAESTTLVTQLAVEVLRDYTSAESTTLVTQLAVEILRQGTEQFTATETLAGALTEVATLHPDPVDNIRISQEALERAEYHDNDLRLSQEVLEVSELPDDNKIRLTQEALEVTEHPLQAIRMSQECLEVVLAGKFVRVGNHSFIRAYMGMGKGKNASFSV